MAEIKGYSLMSESVAQQNLVGREFYFFGVDNNQFRLWDVVQEDLLTLEAVEDPDDGFRSCLEGLVRVEDKEGIFFDTPIALVRIVDAEEALEFPDNTHESLEGFRLVDVADGHVWLEVGTADTSDYYPYFVFTYNPKAPVENPVN